MENYANRFEYVVKIILYILAALLPVWFLPFPIGVEFGREVTFTVLIIAAAILWFLSILTQGEFRYQRSPLLYVGALLFLVFGASTLFSKVPQTSFLLGDAAGEKFSTLILGLLLMMLAGSVFKRKEETLRALFFTLFTGTIFGLINAAQLYLNISIFKYLNVLGFAQGIDFNVIGTVNGLALFYGALLMVSVGTIVSAVPLSSGWIGRYLPWISFVVFAFNLIIINFLTSWVILLGSAIFLFGLMFRGMHSSRGKFHWRYWLTLVLLVFSIFTVMLRSPLIKNINIPAEVSPSLRATLGIAAPVYKEGIKNILLGTGPATFGYDWARYKDPSINQTLFWNVRFNQGSSLISTLLVTSGILGFLSFLAFLITALLIFTRAMIFSRAEAAVLPLSLLLGLVFLFLAFFLYPANFSLILLFFFLAGALTLLVNSDSGGFWDVKEQIVRFEAPWTVFLSSLVFIFLLSLGVAALYLQAGRVRAAFLVQSGLDSLAKGNFYDALKNIEQAVLIESDNSRHYQALIQARMEKIKNLIQQASSGKDVKQEFQSTVSLAVQNAQRAIELNPQEEDLWRIQGSLYELIIPFIQGAERFSLSSYQKASELDPLNPELYLDKGRAGIVLADRIQLFINQAKGQERESFEKERIAALQEVEQNLGRAIDVKGDYAPAHFLLAQTAIRAGNIDKAVQSAENAKLAAPFDIGVAFQLGLLYYQKNDLIRARSEFERAVSLNQNYSNARYFLGLIYDRQGEKSRAIEEFENVLSFNPDNQEVQKILANLRSGDNALKGIAPPGEAPDKRKTPPVRERKR